MQLLVEIRDENDIRTKEHGLSRMQELNTSHLFPALKGRSGVKLSRSGGQENVLRYRPLLPQLMQKKRETKRRD